MTTTSNLAWIDLETTGLDPDVHDILEIGIIITDRELREVARKSWLIYAHGREWSREALDMHQSSGIVDELLTGTTIELAAADARRFIDRNGAGGSPMCGASVHFDRAFLRRRAMHLHEAFHYRNFDVSTLRMAAELAGLEVPDKKRGIHRALPDLEDSIALARWCVQRMHSVLGRLNETVFALQDRVERAETEREEARAEADQARRERDEARAAPERTECGETRIDALTWRARCLDAEAGLSALRATADYHADKGGTDLDRALRSVGR